MSFWNLFRVPGGEKGAIQSEMRPRGEGNQQASAIILILRAINVNFR